MTTTTKDCGYCEKTTTTATKDYKMTPTHTHFGDDGYTVKKTSPHRVFLKGTPVPTGNHTIF
jgi:hypothetical protein